MRLLTLCAVLGGLLSASACGTPSRSADNGGSGTIGSTPGGGISSSVTPASGGLPPAMRPNPAQPDSRAVDLKPVRWTSADPAGKEITVNFTTTGRAECNVLGRVDVVETAQAVTVTLLLGRLPNVDCGGAQPQLAASNATVVTLREPVGTRPVRDGAAK
jgi:hypothetical protein